MSKPYSKDQWIEFREEMIERDGGLCRVCGRGVMDGVVLQVHHKSYRSGAKPWDYAYDECETLCKGCHAQEHGIIRPSFGWDFLGDEDLEDLSGICEYCGQDIRYVFHIQHPHWEPLAVGTDCCDNLTGTRLASNHMESVRRFATRRARFISSARWKNVGGRTAIRQKRMDIAIQEVPAGFQILMNGHSGKERFQRIEEAKKKVFEVIENGKAESYFQRVQRVEMEKAARQRQRVTPFRRWRGDARSGEV